LRSYILERSIMIGQYSYDFTVMTHGWFSFGLNLNLKISPNLILRTGLCFPGNSNCEHDHT